MLHHKGLGDYPEAGSPPTSPSSPGPSPISHPSPSPPPWPAACGSSADGPYPRKRQGEMFQSAAGAGAAFSSDAIEGDDAAGFSSAGLRTGASASDEGVASLLPKMKRMRLRPSLGQLRLQREANEVLTLPPELQVCVQPEQLRATVIIGGATSSSGQPMAVHLEMSFPTQYPHKPPKVTQVLPDEPVPHWQYDGRCVALVRLTDRHWSSAMGVSDVLRDLVQATSSKFADRGDQCAHSLCGIAANAASTEAFCRRGTGPACPQASAVCSSPSPDVEMA